jgi:hypothetical protein
MGGKGMTAGLSQYKWLLVAEGRTDVNVLSGLFAKFGVDKNDILLFSAHGKSIVCNGMTWYGLYSKKLKVTLLSQIKNDLARKDFCGVILLVDSDEENGYSFGSYRRSDKLPYISQQPPLSGGADQSYVCLDYFDGIKEIPIYGISVPVSASGCLETDLLASYGFPVEGQTEYVYITDAIKKASSYWRIPKHGDGKEWWEVNEKAKLDKFIYAALMEGFEVSGETPMLLNEPEVVKRIKKIIL